MKKAFSALILGLLALSACAGSGRQNQSQQPDTTSLAAYNARLAEVEARFSKPGLTEDERAAALKQLSDIVLECCRDNMDKTFPLELLKRNIYDVDKAGLVELAGQNPKWLEGDKQAGMKARILAWKNTLPGADVADLVMADTAGVERHLRDLIRPGRLTLIDFWASWCGPCRANMPALKALYKKYHAKGFDIIGVSFDGQREAWVKAINTVAGGLPWQHISDLKGWESAGSTTYGVMGIPYTLLVGPDGKIIGNDLSDSALSRTLADTYKDAPAE